MNRMRIATLTMTALACSVASQAQQSQTSGAIRGKVVSRSGKALPGATIAIRNLDTGFARSIQAGGEGTYSLPLLPLGTYEVVVTAQGMKPLKDGNVRVTLGSTAVMNFTMDAAEVGATVEVVSTSEALDAQQVNTVASIKQEAVQAIPLVNRNFQDLARLTPGMVAGSGNPPRLIAEGGRQIFNSIQIDGANNNSSFFGEQRGGAFIPFTFGADTIKELQVITNGYDTQYGQAGATVNAVTKTGTNEFSGTALYELRKTSWSAKPKPVPYDPNGNINTPTNLQRYNDAYNLNFNVGGPILKDKLFFFAGVETFNKSRTANPVLLSLGATGSGNTLTDYQNFIGSRLGQVVANTRGLTIAQEYGNPYEGVPSNAYDVEATNTVYFARLDYALNANHRFVLRTNYTELDDTLLNTSQNLNNAESNIITAKISAVSWVVEANNIWSPNLFTESRLQIAREARPMRANAVPGTPSIQVRSSNMTVGTKTSTPRESNELVSQLFSQTTYVQGDWTFKGGIDLTKTDVDNQFFQNNSGSFVFSTYAMAADWADGTVSTTPSSSNNITYAGAISPYSGRIDMWTTVYSGFLQAGYNGLMSKRLNLTAGIRYTAQDFSDNPAPNANLAGLDQASSASALDPRLAFSLDLDGSGRTILRGGLGWFSSPTPLLLHSNSLTGNGNIITNYSFALNGSGLVRNAFSGAGALSANSLISGSNMRKATDAELLALVAAYPGSAGPTGVWDPDNQMSRARKFSLGIEHDTGNGLLVGAKATQIQYDHLQYFTNINLGQVGGSAYNDGYAPGVNSWSRTTRPNYAIVRGRRLDFSGVAGNPTAGFGDVFLSRADGYGKYLGLTLTADKRWSEKAGLSANVTFSRSYDTGSAERSTYTSGPTDSPFSEIGSAQMPIQNTPSSNYGLSNNDRLMVFNAVAWFPVGLGINASLRYTLQTGLPYTAYDARDNNGDGVKNEFAMASRNTQRQPNVQQMDIRVSRSFPIYRKVELEGIVDVYNLFNTANQNIPNNNQVANQANGSANPAFGKVSGIDYNTRELQLGLRLKF